MPQLNQLFLVYQSQWFWLLLVLAVIYLGIAKNMVPKIERVVEDRNATISGDLAAAEKARAEADEAEARALAADGQQGRLFIGFAAAELLGLIAFAVAMIILYGFNG